MKKQRIEHNSALDALITVSKRLSCYEIEYKMDSEKFRPVYD